MWMLGQFTVTVVTGDEVRLVGWLLLAVTEAVLVSVPHIVVVVCETTWMAIDECGPIVAKVQVSTWGLAVEMEQPDVGGVTDAIVQLSPAGLLGRVSVTLTLKAVPAPLL